LADQNIFLDWLEETTSKLPTLSNSFIIGGDFNIHAKELGSYKNDAGAGRILKGVF